jgi:uncharacterized protein (UPF0297 family)
MIVNFINKIDKEDMDDIKKILDNYIISDNYNKHMIPMDMLIDFVEDKDIYQTTKKKNLITNIIYIVISLILILGTIYLFPLKNIENLSKFTNFILLLLMIGLLTGLYTQLPYLLRKTYPHLFLNNEINDIAKNVIPANPGQMTIYRDLLNNLNKILDKEDIVQEVKNYLLDNSFEKKTQNLKLIEEQLQRARSLLETTQQVVKDGTIIQNLKIIEKDFKYLSSLKGYILIKRSSQKNKSKYKPELFYNLLHALKNVYLANSNNELDLSIIKAYYEIILKRMIEMCEERNFYTELFQMAFESYLSENIYLFSIFQEITTKKGLNFEIIFQKMKDKHVEPSIKILGYMLNKIESFIGKVRENDPDSSEEFEIRVNILKASIPENIINKAIELWNREII